jgi:hypothetical protein
MKNYIVEETDLGTVIYYEQNDVRYSFPTDPNNSDYAEYLRYTAWVDEGNDPNEFWNGALDG